MQTPRSFSCAVGAKVHRDEDRNDTQERHGEREFEAFPGSEEDFVRWSVLDDGYFASTVGKHGDESTIGKYGKNQGRQSQKLDSDFQPGIFIYCK